MLYLRAYTDPVEIFYCTQILLNDPTVLQYFRGGSYIAKILLNLASRHLKNKGEGCWIYFNLGKKQGCI